MGFHQTLSIHMLVLSFGVMVFEKFLEVLAHHSNLVSVAASVLVHGLNHGYLWQPPRRRPRVVWAVHYIANS
jgi:hypothetical protein